MAICIIYLLPSLIEEASLSDSSFSAGSSRWFSGLRKQKTNWFGHHTGSVPKPSHRSGPRPSPSPSCSCSCSTGASPSFSCPLRTPQKDNARVELVFYFTCFLCYLKLTLFFFLGFGSEVNRLDGNKSREYKCHYNCGTYKTKGERVEALLGKDIGESGYILIDLLDDSQCASMFPNHFEINFYFFFTALLPPAPPLSFCFSALVSTLVVISSGGARVDTCLLHSSSSSSVFRFSLLKRISFTLAFSEDWKLRIYKNLI